MANIVHAVEEAVRGLAADSITMASSYRMNRIPTIGLYLVTAQALADKGASHLRHVEMLTAGDILAEVLPCL